MKNKSELPAKTSAAQLQWAGCLFFRFLCAFARHVQKFGIIYGFLAGSVTTLCFLAAFIWYGLLAFPLPWKITDASDPRFNPVKFEFTDYSSDRGLQNTLDILFPVGTDKEDVDKILVNIGYAKITEFTGKDHFKEQPTDQRYYYTYGHLRNYISAIGAHMPEEEFRWKISIIYDENNKLKKIHVI